MMTSIFYNVNPRQKGLASLESVESAADDGPVLAVLMVVGEELVLCVLIRTRLGRKLKHVSSFRKIWDVMVSEKV